jgi:hypothetical protein
MVVAIIPICIGTQGIADFCQCIVRGGFDNALLGSQLRAILRLRETANENADGHNHQHQTRQDGHSR